MDQEILDKLHKTEIEILDVFVSICEKYNLKYFLMYGTLLGAIRHKGFIPWDDDIDVIMPLDDYNYFNKIAQNELGNKYFLQNDKTDRYFGRCFSKIRKNNTAFYGKGDKNKKQHNGIFIDIFPMFYTTEKMCALGRLLHKIAMGIDQYLIVKSDKHYLSKRYWFWCIFPRRLLVRIRRKVFNCKKGDYFCDCDFRCVYNTSDFDKSVKYLFEGKEYETPQGYERVLETMYGDYMQLPPVEQRVAHYPEFISFDLSKEE